ncbi:MAG: hypothetical protein B6I24_09990 [Bacteroidetes bacterium 4572_128]|nr:MAG: hypothetical protein B6I24_09990 [Bacteroidetes bacterium 4572_128]
MKRKINLLILILFIISNNFNAQEFSIHSLKIGAGYGVSHGKKNSGFGIFHSFGYQKNIWKNRFRLNPNFSFGTYSTKLFTCVKDEYFNSINFEINLFFDFIKTENYSLFIGNGSFLNHSKGLIGTGGDPESYGNRQESEYTNYIYFGLYITAGLRYNNPNKRIALNIMPFNFHIGTSNFFEVYGKIEIDIKF